MKEAKKFVEDGVVPQTIIRGYRKAAELAIQKLKDMSIDLTTKTQEEKNDMLRKCAETTLNSKLVADYKEFFADMVVKAINILGDDLDYQGIGMKKVSSILIKI